MTGDAGPGSVAGALSGAVTGAASGVAMTPERWAVVTRIVQDALDRAPGERGAFVSAACGDDAALRSEVESLLAESLGATSLPGARAAVRAAAAEVGSAPPRHAVPIDASRVAAALAGQYAIEGLLGRGGMAAVYRAHDLRHGRTVAVKVLDADVVAALGPERFLREIETAAQLSEPHILPLFDSGEEGGLLYYVMPYIAGGTLGDRIAGGRALPQDEAVRILRDVAVALAYAHARGVVHRDIKPENVLIHEGTAVVSDFGIAKALRASQATNPRMRDAPADVRPNHTLTQLGTSLGTPAYMAPEQAVGDGHVDARADLYAWGVVAYTLLAGRHPFAHKTTARELIAAQLDEMPQPLRSVAPAVSPPLAALVMRCLAKDPAQRPASAADLLVELDDGRASAARAVVPRPRRVRIMRAVGAVLALVVLGRAGWQAFAAGEHGGSGDAVSPRKVAVLPFDHAGPPDQAVFTDGLTDAVTAKLSALPGLAVIDRHSAAQYAHTTKTARQIGSELGVPWLVEGVVRWAKDAHGAWRAQVTPTLVDARTGTTTWTGEPSLITPADPFTAQSQVATTVASELGVALRPSDRVALARRLTDNPEALAAYVRGRVLFDGTGHTFSTVAIRAAMEQSAVEFARAVALDPGFGDAWGDLARARFWRAQRAPDDTAGISQLRTTLTEALAHAPDNPGVLLAVAATRQSIDHDTTGVAPLLQRVIAALPNESLGLRMAGMLMADRGQYDSAYALARRAAVLDPRSALTLTNAAASAISLRHWADARKDVDALIALDSADERGWLLRVNGAIRQGDTADAQRVAARALPHLPHPGGQLLTWLAYAGGPYGPRYLTRSAAELGIATLEDSVGLYYDAKTDVCLRRGDLTRARVYSDSIRAILARRPLARGDDALLLALRAFAEANLGDTATARTTLARALRQARALAPPADSLRVLDPEVVAGTYARLGEPETAVRWLDAWLANPMGGRTLRGIAISPKLAVLRGTPEFARFLRAHAE